MIGRGAFGIVYKCTYDGEEGVAKALCPDNMRANEIQLLKTEVRTWSAIRHENCVQFRGVVFGDRGCCYLLSEYMPGGDLGARLKTLCDQNTPPPTLAAFCADARQIAAAMTHLHSRQIIHRDLKPENVLVAADGRLCVGDFGLARHCYDQRVDMTAETGSYRYMAPEVVRHEPYGPTCDVYSFAILCWELYTYVKPWSDKSAVKAAMAVAVDGARPEWPADAPSSLVAFCNACWETDADKRPSFERVSIMLGHQLATGALVRSAHVLATARGAFDRAGDQLAECTHRLAEKVPRRRTRSVDALLLPAAPGADTRAADLGRSSRHPSEPAITPVPIAPRPRRGRYRSSEW